jgi:hypothetical protein
LYHVKQRGRTRHLEARNERQTEEAEQLDGIKKQNQKVRKEQDTEK